MEEYEDIFDEEFDLWQEEERQRQEDYFDEHADEMYEQYVFDYYQKLEDENKFVLISDTPKRKEYIVPGTNVHKMVVYDDNGNIISTSHYKQYTKEN